MTARSVTKILTEIAIDNYNFQVTTNPFETGSCILWFMDAQVHISFTALGKFSGFDRKKVLNFITKYATNPELRLEIENRKFESKINNISLRYFDQIARASTFNQERAYRNLFELDSVIPKHSLSKRMKMMVKKFHPDVGGDTRAMAVINEAYSFLSNRAV